MAQATTSHGTLIARAPSATPSTFTTIGGLGDLMPPSFSRNSFDVTTQNDDIDEYGVGVLRREEVTFPINLLLDDPTHDHLTGLYKSLIDGAFDGWKVTYPTGEEWIMSGYVTNIAPKAPVDGVQQADVTVRMSGPMYIDGVLVS